MAYVTLDFETFYGTGYSLTSLSYEQYIFDPRFYVHSVGIKIDQEPTQYFKDADVAPALHALFTPGNNHTLICHNCLFDGAILSWYYKLAAGRYWCTQKMSRGLWPQARTSLEQLSIRLWPDDPAMRKGKELANFRNVERLTDEQHEQMGGYCVQDVELTFAAAVKMFPQLPDDEIEAIEWTLYQFIHPVIRVDQQRLTDFLIEHRAHQAALIAATGTTRDTLASNMKFAAWLQETHGLEIPRVLSPTPKDPENTKLTLSKQDKEFIEIQLDHPELQHVWDGRMAATSNIAETRAQRMLLHSSVHPDHALALPLQYYGAHTGRWSGCNKINVQNFQSGSAHRLSLTAPPGYVIGVCDLANIEGRVLAWFAEQMDKCEAFGRGEDLYNRMASAVYGRPIDRKKKLIHPDTGKEYHPDKTEGFVGKTLELGLGYGMGAKKLRHTFMVGGRDANRLFFSAEECEHFVRIYRTMNDRIAACWKYAQKMLYHMTSENEAPVTWRCLTVGYRWIRLPNGMYLSYPNLRRQEDERTGEIEYVYWNGKFDTHIHGGKLIENIIQALARIILNDARRAVSQYLAQYNDTNQRVAMTVHDEVVAVLAEGTAPQDMAFIKAEMRKTPQWANDGLLVLDVDGGYDVCYSK